MAKVSNRAALFARYSSKLQDELSLDAQLTEMERFCRRENLDVTHRFLLPETRSAVVERTEEFQDMIRQAKAKRFDVLVVHKLDRFTRSRDTAVTYKALLRRHGVQVRSVTENLGDSIYDRLIEGILEAFNEFYSLNLAEETKKGQRAATRAGRWTGGTFPYGFKKGEDGDGHPCYEVDEPRAKIVRAVYEKYAAGSRTGEILDWIEEGTGKRWSLPTLKNRLANPIYKGVLQYGKTSLDARGSRVRKDPDNLTLGMVPAIVSTDLWEQCRAVAEKNKRRTRKPRYNYLLTEGTAVCADCGRPLVGAYGGGTHQYPYYRCSGWRDQHCARQSATRADKLDELMTSHLLEVREELSWERYQKAFDRECEVRNEAILQQVKEVQQALARLREERENFMNFIASNPAAAKSNTIARRLLDIEREEGELAEQLAKVQIEESQWVSVVERHFHSYVDRAMGYLEKEPGSTDWKEGVRCLFRFVWDFHTKKGQLKLVDPFPNPGPESRSWKMDFRSAQISQLPTIVEILLAG